MLVNILWIKLRNKKYLFILQLEKIIVYNQLVYIYPSFLKSTPFPKIALL